MAFVKSPHAARCLDCRHVDASTPRVLTWMARSRPGIRWQSPAHAETGRPGFGLASIQPRHSS